MAGPLALGVSVPWQLSEIWRCCHGTRPELLRPKLLTGGLSAGGFVYSPLRRLGSNIHGGDRVVWVDTRRDGPKTFGIG